MRTIYLVASAALAITGCEKAAADRVEKSETTIDDRGARPQYLLRYDIPEGFAQQVDAVVDVDMHMSGAQTLDVAMPRMVMTQAVTVDDVDARKAMHVVVDTANVTIVDDGRADPRVVQGMEAATAALDGFKVTAQLLPDGRTRGLKFDVSALPASAGDQISQMEQALQQMVAILPDVSVGEGARWTVDQTIRMSNMRMLYTMRYEVLAISADHATLHIDMEVTAPPQPVRTPQGTVHLDALVGNGSFDMELDLHKMVDHVAGELKMGMTMSGGGQSFDLDVITSMQMLPAGDEPAPRR